MSRINKTVSFNISDPFESEMYEHSKKYSNFSGYVKRLIQNSMNTHTKNEKEIISRNTPLNSPEIQPVEQPKMHKDFMRQLI
ncbi:hypothetical protein [Lederbergia lenta]|uniref:hypothetical protein n=1 Tax=Lederbergia lenta TaxID=1467 RepID=UPI002041A1BD|nr:hypothetical protein [Lederbergia lenta]MCM3110013.1 hypothetical protein [Lederbergia lenta]